MFNQESSSQPIEVADPQIKNLEWNRYVSKNFVILSIDNDKGKQLTDSLEAMKNSCLTRWGFPDIKFSKECRVFVVPDYELLKKLFNLNIGKTQLRKELNVIWCVGDSNPDRTILPLLTQVCLSEYEVSESVSLPLWFKRGCISLNNSVSDIRENLKNYNEVARKELFAFSVDQMFSFTDDDYNKQTTENKKLFDQQASCLCLLLRKEFGEVKLQGLLRLSNRNKIDDLLKILYGFKTVSQFDKSYVRFMKDLCADISDNQTPDSYLQIKSAR
jgi:hypothetical protein